MDRLLEVLQNIIQAGFFIWVLVVVAAILYFTVMGVGIFIMAFVVICLSFIVYNLISS